MKNLSLSIVVAIFLHGCLYNNMDSLNNFYQKDIKSKKQLIKTQKAILYDGNKTKAILVATYSNDFDDINSSDERFVVSFYADDINGTTDSNPFGNYFVTLNSNNPIEIKPLDIDDKLLSNISFKNEWKEYYLVIFPHMGDKMYMSFGDSLSHDESRLYFSKKLKYIYNR